MVQVLTDVGKKKWTLGRTVGTGGFGEIYMAEEGEVAKVPDDSRYGRSSYVRFKVRFGLEKFVTEFFSFFSNPDSRLLCPEWEGGIETS